MSKLTNPIPTFSDEDFSRHQDRSQMEGADYTNKNCPDIGSQYILFGSGGQDEVGILEELLSTGRGASDTYVCLFRL
jgi:hypothetical protein